MQKYLRLFALGFIYFQENNLKAMYQFVLNYFSRSLEEYVSLYVTAELYHIDLTNLQFRTNLTSRKTRWKFLI